MSRARISQASAVSPESLLRQLADSFRGERTYEGHLSLLSLETQAQPPSLCSGLQWKD